MGGDLGDGGAVVALEPGCSGLARRHTTGQCDLEWAFAELDLRGSGTVAEVFLGEAVELVVAPVEFFLEGDHLAEQGLGLGPGGGQRGVMVAGLGDRVYGISHGDTETRRALFFFSVRSVPP